MKPCAKCQFVDSLLADPRGEQLFAAWCRMRRMEPAFDSYLADLTLAEATQQIIAKRVAEAPSFSEAARSLGMSRSTLWRKSNTLYRVRDGRTANPHRK